MEGDVEKLDRKMPFKDAKDHARITHMLTQLSQPLYHIHKVGVVHNDIKPKNILYQSRKGPKDKRRG